MPSVKPNESESDYVERCIPIVLHEGTAKDGAQASAICHSMYREHHDKKSGKSLIISNLAADSQIVTADHFMKSLQLCLGGDGAACSLISKNWDVVIKEAAERLTYTAIEPDDIPLLSGTHLLSKNVGTLSQGSILDFEAIITTTRKDRDGDVLETSGAELDPQAPLLLFHNPDLPIGKVLGKTKHTKDMMAGRFSVLDTALGRDAKTLVEGGALRISHGFEPTEFEPLEGVKGGRWHILKLHIMEVSLVSVPSNVDAVILNFSNGKLHSPLMKSWGKSLYEHRPVQGIGFEPEEKHECSCHEKGKRVVLNERRIQVYNETGHHDPLRWNKRLSKTFDVAQEYLQASMLEYEWVSRFLSCDIKQVFQNTITIPSARMGTWLTGLQNILGTKGAKTEDIRNITSSGKENPPQYEVIQLNSTQSRDFLVDGITFYKSSEGNFVINLSPSWYGLNVTLYTTVKDKELNRSIIDLTWQWAKSNNFLKGEAFSLSGEFLTRDSICFEDVFLTETNEKPLKRMLRQLNEKQLKCANRGMIFMGPPGTGKTLSGKIIKNDAHASFIWISARDFHRMGMFGSFTYAFDIAKEIAPTVLFFEDVDNWLDSYAVDLLKTEMDGIGKSSGVITILTTNFPERIPEALIDRPGRFHDVLKFDLPTPKERQRMLSKWLEGIDATVIGQVVEKTNGFSGAHLFELAAFAKTICEQDEEPLSNSVFKALEKIAEQRELITEAQLSGSRFKPRRDFNITTKRKGLKMDGKANNDAEFPTMGEQQDKPGDLYRFGGMGSQQGDTGFVPEEDETDKPGTAEAGESDATGDVSNGDGVGKDIPVTTNKGGRAISAKNRERLMDAKDHLDMVMGMDKTHVSSQAKTLVKAAHGQVSAVCSEPDEDDKGIPDTIGFDLDPSAYDISKCAAIVLLRMHEIDTDLLFQIAGEADKHLLQAAYEKVSGGS